MEDWSESDVLTQVIAASQQEYLDSLKKLQQHKHNSEQHAGNETGLSSGQEPNEMGQDEGPTVPESVPASDNS